MHDGLLTWAVRLVQKAESLPGVSVVSLAWLSDSCDQGKRLPEANYSLVAGAVAPPTDSADAKDTTSTSKTKKRRRADTPELDEDAGVPAADDTEQSTKKLKSEPKSSSTGLNVPIDENCTMNGQCTWPKHLGSPSFRMPCILLQQ